MGKPLVIKYTYFAECSIHPEKIEKTKKNIRELVANLFSCCEDKSEDYTKLKPLDNAMCKGFLILKSSSFSSVVLELNEVINTILITLHCSKSIVAAEMDKIIIHLLTPEHFNSSIFERIMP